MKKIKFELSSQSIQEAIDELQKYQDDLNHKCEEMCRRLLQEGDNAARVSLAFSSLGSTITLESTISPQEIGCKAILVASGQYMRTRDYPPFNTLLAVEFGAGIRYNSTNENPKAAEFGMGVGTFSDKHFGLQDTWYYYGDDNKWHAAHGVEATMPMYNASVKMRERITEVAKEVFETE